MHVAVALLLLCSCDRFFQIEEVGDPDARRADAVLGDGSIHDTPDTGDALDGPTDGRIVDDVPQNDPCANPSFVQIPESISAGPSFTAYNTHVASMTGTDVYADGTKLSPAMMTDSLSEPRLAPSGTTLYMRQDSPATGASLVVSTFTAGSWGTPVHVFSFSTNDAVPSTPTAASSAPNDLRLIYTHAGNAYEVMHMSSIQHLETARSVSGMTFVEDVQLAPNGLSIVFVGTTFADPTRHIYRATRGDLTDNFSNPILLFDSGDAETTPFMTPDCANLYFSNQRLAPTYKLGP